VADANLTGALLRPDDLLALRFEFVNLTLDTRLYHHHHKIMGNSQSLGPLVLLGI
jgi:hypothetical protein